MDITSARTFLAIAQSGSFAAAAEKLNVTQTAVSARVHALEDLLGQPLFVRNKKGARLTVAGERFFRHAVALVQTWENARQQIAMPAGRAEGVSRCRRGCGGNLVGVVSGYRNPNDSGVGAPERRPRHETG